jgi:hypothetical protein
MTERKRGYPETKPWFRTACVATAILILLVGPVPAVFPEVETLRITKVDVGRRRDLFKPKPMKRKLTAGESLGSV